MHKQHQSEDKENQVELQVIDEIQSGITSKKSTPSHSRSNTNGNAPQQLKLNDESGKYIF